MAIALDAATTSAIAYSSSPRTFAHTVGSGSNRLLIVGVATLWVDGVTCNSVTYNDVAMVKARADHNATSAKDVESSIWILHNPPTGAHSVVITPTGSTYIGSVAVSYTGCVQTCVADAVNGNTGTAAGDQVISVNTIADNCWIFACGGLASGTTITADQTSRGNSNDSPRAMNCEDTNAAQTPAEGHNIGFTIAGATLTWAISGASFAPVAEAAGGHMCQVIIV